MSPSSCFSLASFYEDYYLHKAFTSSGLSSKTVEIGCQTTIHFWSPNPTSCTTTHPPLVLLHGFGANPLWQWHRQVQSLYSQFSLYVPDLIFFGESTTKSLERSEIFQSISIGKLLEMLGVERYSVMGTSYGGFVAYHMARMFPERVEKVVIASSAVNMRWKDNDELLKKAKLERIEDFLLPSTAAQLRTVMGMSMFKCPFYLPDFLLNDVLHRLFSENREEKRQLLKRLTNGRMAGRNYHSQRTLQLDDTHFIGPTPSYNLVCKILDEKTVHNINDFIASIQAMWNINRNTYVRWTGARNIFIVEFPDQKGLDAIHIRTPWYLRGGILMMTQPLNQGLPPEMHNFNMQKFIIRIRLRRDMQRGNIPYSIASQAGIVQKMAKQDNTHYLATVMVKVKEPLVTYLNITLFDKQYSSVWFEYQKFPYAICKRCFVLDHSPELCNKHAKKKESLPGSHLVIYDPSLDPTRCREVQAQMDSDDSLDVDMLRQQRSKGKNPVMYHSELGEENSGRRNPKRIRFVDGETYMPSFGNQGHREASQSQYQGSWHDRMYGRAHTQVWIPSNPQHWPIIPQSHVTSSSNHPKHHFQPSTEPASSSSNNPPAAGPSNQFDHQNSIIRSTLKLTIDDLYDIND